MSRSPGIRTAGWLVLLLASLFFVTWRQTRGVALEGSLRDLQSRTAIVETEQVELVRRIEELRSRARVLRVARDRLGMRLPEDGEIVYLPGAAESSAPASEVAQ